MPDIGDLLVILPVLLLSLTVHEAARAATGGLYGRIGPPAALTMGWLLP